MKFLLRLLCICLISKISFGQTNQYSKGVNFKSDNDSYLFFGQDQYYTNGIFIGYQQAMDASSIGPKLEKKIWEISAGQKMYNSFSGNVSNAKKQDRPFAAYLFASGGISWFLKNETVIKSTLAVGIIGPSAKGEESQKLIHDLVGFYPISGWEHQIRDVVSITAQIEAQKLVYRNPQNSLDISLDGQLQFGNTFNNLGIGANLRLGNFNQLFQSAYTQSVVSKNVKTEKLTERESYFFLKPVVHFVGNDATIQGTGNKKSPVTFDVKRVVFSQAVGYTYSTPRFTFNYTAQFNTKEIKSTAKAHEFGSFTFQYRFN